MPANSGQTGGKPTGTTPGNSGNTAAGGHTSTSTTTTTTTGTTTPPTEGTPAGPGSTVAWPTVEDTIEKLFTAFDTDTNGSIALTEITDVLDPGGHHDQLNAVVRRFIATIDADQDDSLSGDEVSEAVTALDTNGDGSLSPADLGALVAHAGSAPLLAALLQGFPLPGSGGGEPQPEPPTPAGPPKAPTVDQVVDVLITRFDADDDSAVTLAELQAVLGPKGSHGKVATALTALITAVDTSGDGKMSEAELTAAITSLDVDGSGAIDHGDHVPGPPLDDSVDLIGLLMPHMRDFDAATLGHFE